MTGFTEACDPTMIEIEFTSQLVQQVDCPAIQSVEGASVREAFESVFTNHPKLRDHIFDPEGGVLPHLVIFVNGEMLDSPDAFQAPLREGSEVFVMQAVSGG